VEAEGQPVADCGVALAAFMEVLDTSIANGLRQSLIAEHLRDEQASRPFLRKIEIKTTTILISVLALDRLS